MEYRLDWRLIKHHTAVPPLLVPSIPLSLKSETFLKHSLHTHFSNVMKLLSNNITHSWQKNTVLSSSSSSPSCLYPATHRRRYLSSHWRYIKRARGTQIQVHILDSGVTPRRTPRPRQRYVDTYLCYRSSFSPVGWQSSCVGPVATSFTVCRGEKI